MVLLINYWENMQMLRRSVHISGFALCMRLECFAWHNGWFYQRCFFIRGFPTRWQDCASFENSMNAGKVWFVVLARQNCIHISLATLFYSPWSDIKMSCLKYFYFNCNVIFLFHTSVLVSINMLLKKLWLKLKSTITTTIFKNITCKMHLTSF